VRFNRRPTIVIDKFRVRKEIKHCNWHVHTFDMSTFTKVFNILDKHKYKWTINTMCDNWYRVTYAGPGEVYRETFDPIDRAFRWASTPEGYKFWNNIWETDFDGC